jgi:hypothetical protein
MCAPWAWICRVCSLLLSSFSSLLGGMFAAYSRMSKKIILAETRIRNRKAVPRPTTLFREHRTKSYTVQLYSLKVYASRAALLCLHSILV